MVNLETETPYETKLNELLDIADLHSEDVSESQSDRSQEERELSTSLMAEV